MSASASTTHIHKRHGAAAHVDTAANLETARSADLATIQEQLLQLVSTAASLKDAAAGLAQLALELISADRVAYFTSSTTGQPSLVSEAKNPQVQQIFSPQQIVSFCAGAIKEPGLKVARTQHAAMLSVPVPVSEQQTDLIIATLSLRSGPIEPFVVSLQMIAAHATLWWQQQEKQQVDWEADMTAGIVEIVAAVEQSDGSTAASIIMANKLHELTGARQVAIGLREKSNSWPTLRAISEHSEVDGTSETGRLLTNAMNEASLRDDPTVWPPASPDDRAGLLAHQKLARQCRADGAMTYPLASPDGEMIGAVTLLTSGGTDNSRLAAYGRTAAPFLASAMQTVRKLEGGRLKQTTRKLAEFSASRSKQLVAAVVVLALVVLTPIPHKIGCDCEVEAAARRFVVAPYAGILRETLARPGDVVKANQLLATMDDREINWELAGLIADRDRAAKEYDIALSNNEAAKMQMSRLAVQRDNLKIQLLEHRKETMEIRAAVAGVILRGDLEQVHSAPVDTGQALFEIAPLDQQRLQIRIPEEDVAYVNLGMRVTLRLDALPGQQLTGTVKRIHPQAEVIDSQNVFLAEVELVDVPQGLRPGMHGNAKVVGARRPLGWVYFHRPWQRLVNFLR